MPETNDPAKTSSRAPVDAPKPQRLELLCGLLVWTLLCPGGARAQETRALPAPGVAPWEALHFPKVERHTRYEPIPDAAHAASLRSDSECSASGFALPLDDIDLSQTPRLSWRWRIHEGLRIKDERSKAGDDFAARVYVLFAYDSRRSSMLERLLRRAAELFYGRKLPGEAINYVWASRVPVGEQWPNPFSDAAHMVSLQTHSDTSDASSWLTEVVDLAADRKLFLGEPLPRIEGIALMTDTDNSCSRASAEFADFRLLGPPR